LAQNGYVVYGIDNNQRAVFFGDQGDTRWNQRRLQETLQFEDFDTNVGGTLNLLEAVRRYCPESPFVHMSTNKVYGERPVACDF
jgi:CDP-paratose 2-epimerase